jgi:Ca-activated chloride channel family protein
MLRPSLVAIIGLTLISPAALAQTVSGSVGAGNALYSEGKYDEALKQYKAAQVESPTDERIMFNLGNAQYKLGWHDEALSEHLMSAQSVDPKIRAQSHYNSGNALYRMGRLEDAVEQYLKALEIDPDDEDAKFNLEFVRQEIRRRMNEQQQRREQQQKEKEQEKKDSNDQSSAKQAGQQPEEKTEPSQQEGEQQKKQDGTKGKQEQEPQPEGPPEEEKSRPPEGSGQEEQGQEPQTTPEPSAVDGNSQRWLDAIEAESAENMKEFLRKQQPGGAIVYPQGLVTARWPGNELRKGQVYFPPTI